MIRLEMEMHTNELSYEIATYNIFLRLGFQHFKAYCPFNLNLSCIWLLLASDNIVVPKIFFHSL